MDHRLSDTPTVSGVALAAVPETLLWTLYHRATEARRPDAVLDDPRAIELVDAIDFPFEERFGVAAAGWAQWQALRARCFDLAITSFLERAPDATVVALGEGLETQFWRVDNGRVQWVSVDFEEAIDLRRRLLPVEPRQRLVAASVLDAAWLDQIETATEVLVTAQGLLMYLAPADVHALITSVTTQISRGALLFDAVSHRLAERSRSGKLERPGGYRPPPWLWGVDRAEKDWIRSRPNVAELRPLRLPRGRGPLFGAALPLLGRVPLIRDAMFSIMRARLREPGSG
jgi:O-methyltransferase involved in polyketide biosynthesis